MVNQRINILCSTDENYTAYSGVMLTSLLENNGDVKVWIVVDDRFPDNKRKRFYKLARRYGCEIEFLVVSSDLLKDFPVIDGEITASTYYKIFATQLLPKEIHKIIYLDGDILVRGSIYDLWNTDISDYAMAGVCDLYDNANETYERLGYAKEQHYINAGMLLINLDWWRAHHVYEKCMEYIRKNHERILWCEQDVLNAVLRENKYLLPMDYNYQVQMLMKYHYKTLSKNQQVELLEKVNPLVVHYVGRTKPWNIDYYDCPFYEDWIYYKQKSLWSFRLPVLPKKNKVKAIIKRYVLWPLGWKHNSPYIVLND